ncbi:uncharacterized protein BT62DRAFT_609415 [Guyanagaster necrorhizus]|uniref:Uncharacterized protein n=1 Tax=Guyanagaster necrorhizus TaxID=856835 RepID=A0A9P7VZI6_9AGAR|nr:uncharacterized protein BT62DRAFT_609415 [Guyanagaster necrorhizus MCA 3950]KAG7449829.1 hypothetical protein BT62DRAFT_609415 [Guyanagaster necrorhizus MCA 3950]
MHVHGDGSPSCYALSASIHYDKMQGLTPFYHAACDSDDSLIVSDVPPWSESLEIPLFHGLVRPLLQPNETDFLRDILDRTSLATSFDHSCLRYLDLQLLTRPTESFADVCWRDAVHDDDSNERCSLSSSMSDCPTSSPNYLLSSYGEEDAISSSSESLTCHEDHDEFNMHSKQSYHSDRDLRQVYFSVSLPGERESFLSFEPSPYFASSYPAEPVCDLPTTAPVTRDRGKSYHRFTTYCSRMPSSSTMKFS